MERLRFIQNDAMDMQFRNNYFDFVTSFNALEHIPDPLKALEEMIRVTKPGGTICLTFDPIWTADTGSHFNYRVPEPWSHLIDTMDKFIAKLRTAGGCEDEVNDFINGMNRHRLAYYRETFATILQRNDLKMLYYQSWSGFTDTNHINVMMGKQKDVCTT